MKNQTIWDGTNKDGKENYLILEARVKGG